MKCKYCINKKFARTNSMLIVQLSKHCYWWNKSEAGQSSAPRWMCSKSAQIDELCQELKWILLEKHVHRAFTDEIRTFKPFWCLDLLNTWCMAHV